MLGKDRSRLKKSDLQEALNSYRQYLKNYPGSERSGEISLRIQEVEAKIGPGSSGK